MVAVRPGGPAGGGAAGRAPPGRRAVRRRSGAAAPGRRTVGRYVHLDLGPPGQPVDHRIYYEEAGSGIPVLLQHTAGSHGTQWRHLLENPAITDRSA